MWIGDDMKVERLNRIPIAMYYVQDRDAFKHTVSVYADESVACSCNGGLEWALCSHIQAVILHEVNNAAGIKIAG